MFKKVFLNCFKLITEMYKLVPSHQFGFCNIDSAIIIEKIVEHKKLWSSSFFGIAQGFNRVWHDDLLYNLKSILPDSYEQLVKSYPSDRRSQLVYPSVEFGNPLFSTINKRNFKSNPENSTHCSEADLNCQSVRSCLYI